MATYNKIGFNRGLKEKFVKPYLYLFIGTITMFLSHLSWNID